MRLKDYRDSKLKDTGDPILNEAFLQMCTIGMGSLDREMSRADFALFKVQVDNNMLVFCQGARYILLKTGISKTEVDEAMRQIQEVLK